MMKRIFCMIFLLFCGSAVNAAKIALIPTAPELAPLADQVLPAMSNEPGIEFLERANIEAVLKERQLTASGLTTSNLAELGKLIHADLFAIITAKPGKKDAAVSGLIVYDARNGFRMINAMLPEQDAVKEITKYLRQAQDVIKHPEKQILLSVATVRDAGVPERFKYHQAFIAADLERRLGGIPIVTVLERDYLDSVNREREITEQMFKLAPSSRLLRLEFAPGSSPEIVNLTLRVTDAANKELFRFNLDNCLSDTEGTAMKTIAAVSDYLKVSPPNITVSASAEAERFFAESQFFRRLGDYAAAHRKLDAAMALNPENSSYKFTALDWRFRELNQAKSSLVEILDILEPMLEIRLRQDAGKIPNPPILSNQSVYPILDKLRLGIVEDAWGKASSVEKTRLSKYCDQVRTELFRVNVPQKEPLPIYLLGRYYTYYSRMPEFALYYDLDKFKKDKLARAIEYIKLTCEFFAKPENFKIDPEIWIQSNFDFGLEYRPEDYSYRGIQYAPDEFNEYIKIAETHPLKIIRAYASWLRLYGKTIQNDFEPQKFRADMTVFAKDYAKLNPPKLEHGMTLFSWMRILRQYPELLAIANEIVKEHLSSWSKSQDELFFDEVRALKSPEALPTFILNNKTRILEMEKLLKFSDMWTLAGNLQNQIEKNPAALTALNFLNRKMEITELVKPVKMQSHNVLLLVDARLKGDKLYYVGWCPDEIQICVMDLKDFSTKTLYNLKVKANFCRTLRGIFTNGLPIDCDDEILAVGAKDAVYFFKLDGSKSWSITDFPNENVNAIALMNGRIYLWLGQKHQDMQTGSIFLSCDFNGQNRIFHYNGLKENKDKNFPFSIRGLCADPPRNRLLILSHQLLEYRPDTENPKVLLDKPPKSSYASYDSNMMQTMDDGKLYISFGADFVIYDLNADKSEWFFSSLKVAKDRAKYHCEFYAIDGTFYARPGQMWVSTSQTAAIFVDLSARPEIPFFYLQNDGWNMHPQFIYPCPDGQSVVVLRPWSIYKLTPVLEKRKTQ